MSFKVRLFLGFPVEEILTHHLKTVSPAILNSFITEDANYLQNIEIDSISYLGKFADSCTRMHDLELLESNIYSLLNKILPDYCFHQTPLILLAHHE